MPYDGSGFPLTDAVPDAGDPPADFNKATAAIRDLQEANLALSGETIANDGGVSNILVLTQASYDALATKDANTLYVING